MAKKQSKEKRRLPAAAEASTTPSRDERRGSAAGGGSGSGNSIGEFFASKGVRETIESIAIAFILAFLFRTFEAEAFVIPTGSMAETLRGRHKDLRCEVCGFRHTAGGSEGNVDHWGNVVASTCPMCRHVNRFPPDAADVPYYTGDRILVSKFIYDINDPHRWDVVVFKFPLNAKQNYIKRLVGLPGETLRISGGDLWTKPLEGDEPFAIARKPPAKIVAMMQNVHDTNYVPQVLRDAGWPSRWQPGAAQSEAGQPEAGDGDAGWTAHPEAVDEGKYKLARTTFSIDSSSAQTPSWLRYHHLTPTMEDWRDIEEGNQVTPPAPRLITDFYGYNAFVYQKLEPNYDSSEAYGMHWVGDLVMECDVEIDSDEGVLLLDLVEGGVHYRCAIDVADGQATLSIVDIDGAAGSFSDDAGEDVTATVTAETKVRRGAHRLRFANVDNKLTLWVDGAVADFDGPTTYLADEKRTPRWNQQDPGDLAPAGVGSQGAALTVTRLKVFRDVYYIAVKSPDETTTNMLLDYNLNEFTSDGRQLITDRDVEHAIRDVLDHPQAVRRSDPSLFESVFDSRRNVAFDLKKDPADPSKDQFFTLGDNSPQSQDARIWDNEEHYVQRDYLLGKAMFIYWPHALGPHLPNPWDEWRRTFPIVPNVPRMRLVR